MTSSPHGPYAQGYTRATMAGTEGSEAAMWSQSQKAGLSSDWSLQLDSMKLESLVIADQQCRGEYVPGPCTHRPSHHGSCLYQKSLGQPRTHFKIKEKKMYYVYLLLNAEGKRYIGYTSDLRKRLETHNQGKVKSTKGSKWELVYYEAYKSKKDAMIREKRLKDGRAKYRLIERLRNSIELVLK
jgi:predicted GIY-YIG superfamily endonuclease